MSYLHYLCLFVYSGVQHIMCCIFALFHPVYPMLPVSLECPFLIATSIFSNVYFFLHITKNLTSFYLLMLITNL